MPVSKRARKVTLSQTSKKGREAKVNLVEQVRECVETFERCFVFSVNNMRNGKLKEVRNSWKHSRLFFGKNKVIAIALGKDAKHEIADNIHRVSEKLVNEVGVLFTSKPKEDVLDWFSKKVEHDFARSGNKASSTVVIKKGPLTQFSHAIEPHLRQLGLPTKLERGVVTMMRDHTVCKAGQIITPEQASVLKKLNVVLSQFYITIKSMWDKNDGGIFEEFEEQVRENNFNYIKITVDDQQYDYLDAEQLKAEEEEENSGEQENEMDANEELKSIFV